MKLFSNEELTARQGLFLFLLCACSATLQAQPVNAPLNSLSYPIVERLTVLSGQSTSIHASLKPFCRQDIAELAQALRDSSADADPNDLQYLLKDNNAWLPDSLQMDARNASGIKGWFYKTPAYFYEINEKAFRLQVNPILNVAFGSEKGDAELLFANRRGLELSGDIDRKVWFYTNLVEQQVRFPQYVNNRIAQFKTIPGAGFYKTYSSIRFNITNGFDYNNAQAYIGLKVSKHIGLQFGHGAHFIGDGYRSLFLSDFGNNAFFLKFNTRVWRFHYQNLFLELTPFSKNSGTSGDILLLKKYAAIHYLDFRITPKMSVGFFEATVFNRSRQFEFQYLNPIILYRTVEGMIGSPDNVLVGINGKWDLFRHVRLYGQFILDEYVYKELIRPEKKGWWGNKYGFQMGAKYFNALGIRHLDLQAEFNSVRPYTYSHNDSLDSWTHYSHPLAHPLGANFKEFIGIARYQHKRLLLGARLLYMSTGDDGPGENWGSNPLQSYVSRERDYGNVIGQGIHANTILLGFDASWMLFHNCFLDFQAISRRKNSADDLKDLNSTIFSGAIRLNFAEQRQDY